MREAVLGFVREEVAGCLFLSVAKTGRNLIQNRPTVAEGGLCICSLSLDAATRGIESMPFPKG